MAEVVGNIEVVATINSKGYDAGKKAIERGNKELEADAANTGGSIASKFSGAFSAIGKAAAVGLAAATAATVAMVTSSVKSFAEYEQLVGGVDTLFKESNKQVMEYANNAFKTAGLSANEYMSTITGFSASLLQGLGGDTKKAAEIGNLAVTDMADNANKMGTSMDLIQNAYQGFAKDNFTMLDNLKLGYGGTASEMARLVNNSGVMGGSFKATAENVKDIPFDKLIEAIHKTQDELGITGTTAKEASETISGSFMATKASWTNLIAGMADPKANIDTLLDNFIKSAQTFGKNLLPAIGKALDGVVKLVAGLAPVVIAMLPGIISTLLPAVIKTFISIVVSLANEIPKLIPVLVDGFFTLLNGLLTAIPMILPPLIAGLITLITSFIEKLSDPTFLTLLITAAVALFLGIVKAIPQIITALVRVLPDIITNVVKFLTTPSVIMMLIQASITLFMALVKAVPQVVGALIGAVAELLSKVVNKIANTDWGQVGKDIIKGIGNGISSMGKWLAQKAVDAVNGAKDAIKNFFGIKSPSRVMRDEVGKMIGEGLAIGISSTSNIVTKSSIDLADDVMAGWDSPKAYASSGAFEDVSRNEPAGATINQTNNVYSELDMDVVNRNLTWELNRA